MKVVQVVVVEEVLFVSSGFLLVLFSVTNNNACFFKNR